jgi:hypothetical protein
MKRRGKNLSNHDIAVIVEIIDKWSGKLTWPSLCAAVAQKTRQHYTRQALHAHTSIQNAFSRKKIFPPTYRIGGLSQPDISDPVTLLEVENAALKDTVARQQRQINGLQDRFAIWTYNAYAKGLTERDLWRQLPDVDRDQTPESKNSRTPRGNARPGTHPVNRPKS